MSFGTQQSSGKSSGTTQVQRQSTDAALKAYMPTIGQGQQSYQGDWVAPFSDLQNQAFGQGSGYLDQFSPYRNMPAQFGQTGDALSGILSGQTGAQYITPEQTNAYYKSNIYDPAKYEFAKNTAPAIAEQFAGPGYWSSARANAGSLANQELGNWLGTQKGQLDWQTQQQNQAIDEAKANRALSAVPLGMGYSQIPTQEALARLQGTQGVFGGLGAPQQQQAQNQISANMQKFLEQNRITNPEDIQIILSLLGISNSTMSQSSSQFNVGAGNTGMNSQGQWQLGGS